MKISGYYLIHGKNEDDSRKNTLEMLEKYIKPKLMHFSYTFSNFKIIDTQRCPELECWDNEDLLYFENHFIVELNDIEIKEDSQEHYNIENLFNTGISIMDY